MFAQCLDAEGDVLVKRNAEFGCAFDDVFAIDAAGEGFILHAFFHRTDFQIKNAFRGAHIGAGGKEAGEFVAREEGVFEERFARHAAIIGKRRRRTR